MKATTTDTSSDKDSEVNYHSGSWNSSHQQQSFCTLTQMRYKLDKQLIHVQYNGTNLIPTRDCVPWILHTLLSTSSYDLKGEFAFYHSGVLKYLLIALNTKPAFQKEITSWSVWIIMSATDILVSDGQIF